MSVPHPLLAELGIVIPDPPARINFSHGIRDREPVYYVLDTKAQIYEKAMNYALQKLVGKYYC